MAILIGLVLAISVGLLATRFGLDKDRAFYPVVTIVVASYYVLFSVMADSPHALLVELVVCAGFVLAAIAGFRRSLWIVVVALAAHGLQDFVHVGLVRNPGVPAWWPGFCGAYDVAAALYLAWLIRSGRVGAALPSGRRYVYIWAFKVAPEHEQAFLAAYGPAGDWSTLFRKSAGYLETLLLQDQAAPGRYVTVDRWSSERAHDAFVAEFGADYAALDRSLEPLTQEETSLGSYWEITNG